MSKPDYDTTLARIAGNIASERERDLVELRTLLESALSAVSPAPDQTELETLRTLLAAWQKRCYEAEKVNPHGRMVTAEELEPFRREMEERVIPAIVEAVRERQRLAAETRDIPLSSAVSRSQTPALCEDGDCNPYHASCGARFCSYEAMAEHQAACPASSPTPAPEQAEPSATQQDLINAAIQACADYIEANYGDEGREYSQVLATQHWGPIQIPRAALREVRR